MNLTAIIESAEFALRQILEDLFISIYSEKQLQSHGLEHHRRVWKYAKEILYLNASEDVTSPLCDPSKLMIASYMHDIGMAIDPGQWHGRISRELCNQLLIKLDFDPADYTEVLEAIENHDNKSYTTTADQGSLLSILSMADDLDAFGFTGIYRYSEIYTARKSDPLKIGSLIRENASARFGNLEANNPGKAGYLQKHRKRFEILDNFFRNYQVQAETYDFTTPMPAGYCGLFNLFALMPEKNLSLEEFFIETGRYRTDTIIGYYLHGLEKELFKDYQNEHE